MSARENYFTSLNLNFFIGKIRTMMILTSVGYQENQMSVLETAEAHQDLYFFVVLFLKTQVDSISQLLGIAM